MPLSAKTKNVLLAPFAISHIFQRFCLPGIIGWFLLAFGFWKKVGWLKVAGLVLAAPIIWIYFVVIFLFLPATVFTKLGRKRHT